MLKIILIHFWKLLRLKSYVLISDNSNKNILAMTDINECDPAPCQNDAVCNDETDSYSCTCVPGYAGILCEIGTFLP